MKKEENIEISSWYDEFCLPGGYQHCGKQCGETGKYGGGTPINATDVCCRAHDRCWRNFGTNDPCCDKALIDCVKGHTTVAATSIRTFFKNNAARC